MFDQGTFNNLLATKYAILQQNANADTSRANAGMVTANAGANLDAVRAGLLPKQTEADIAEAQSRASLNNVNAANIPGIDKSLIARNYSEAGNLNANSGLARANTGAVTQSTTSLGSLGLVSNPLAQDAYMRLHAALGLPIPLANSGAYGYGPQPVAQP